MKYFAKIIVFASVALLFSAVTHAQAELRIAAAADLKFAMGELSEKFQKQTGIEVKVTYGSSGNFYSQIQNGAPFDLFFSADIAYPRKLEAAGLADPGTLFGYAIGRIAIWMPPDTKVDLSKQGWNALLDASVEKIAIANPEHAPYGRAAVAALQVAGIYESVKSKLVYGENISQAAQFVQSGNAQAGIMAMSLVASPAMRDGKHWTIPTSMHPPIEQAAIVLNNSKNKRNARAFLEFVKTATGRALLVKYGFEFPENSDNKGKK